MLTVILKICLTRLLRFSEILKPIYRINVIKVRTENYITINRLIFMTCDLGFLYGLSVIINFHALEFPSAT